MKKCFRVGSSCVKLNRVRSCPVKVSWFELCRI